MLFIDVVAFIQVPSRSLDTAIEQLPRQLGPKVILSQTESHYDSPSSSSHYQSPRSSQSHSPSPSLTTPTPQYYQVHVHDIRLVCMCTMVGTFDDPYLSPLVR